MRRRSWAVWMAGLLMVAVGLAGCSAPPASTETASSPASSSAPSVTATFKPASPSSAATTLSDPGSACLTRARQLSLSEQVGQLYMTAFQAGTDAADLADHIAATQAGAVVLLGNRTSGLAAVQAETQQLLRVAPAGVPLLTATDQEGGQVQRLTGPGFDTIPSALAQGQLPDAELLGSWQRWGRELRNAGVTWNLAPVADVVPASQVGSNAAVGQLQRGYGSDAQVVARQLAQVIQGLSDARVASSVKHFPGLGQVNENTDYVVAHDRVSTLSAAELAPFQAAIDAGVSSVMVSSAIYDQVDPANPAVFSSAIVTGVLRQQLGFDGVVISDDLGIAAAVASYPVGERGVNFLRAGGDMVIVADAAATEKMVAATLATAQADPGFADELAVKVARVLRLKASFGLFSC